MIDWAPKGEMPGFPGQMQPYVGQEVTVFDASIGAPSEWHWTDFGELQRDVHGAPSVTVTWTEAGAKTVRLRAKNCVGWSAEQAESITVYEDVRGVIADFDAAASLATGEAATFTAGSGPSFGDPVDFTWRFSDGAGASGPTVSHTPSCRGRLGVTLTVSRASHTATITRTIPVTGTSCAAEAIVVSDVAHVAGLGGVLWRTDLRLFNPSSEETLVDLAVLPEGRANPTPFTVGPFHVPAKGALLLDDVLARFTFETVRKAALRFAFTNPDDEAPVVTARTYADSAPAGGFGEAARGVPVRPAASPQVSWLTGLRSDGTVSGSRTNLALTGLRTVDVAGVRLTAYRADGSEIARSGPLGVAPLSYTQGPLALFGLDVGEVGPFSLKVELPAGADVLPCASVIENASGDPTRVCSEAPGDGRRFLPSIAHLPGQAGTNWRSDVQLTNPYGEPRESRLEFIPARTELAVAARTVTLAPNASAPIADVVTWVYGTETAASGMLVVSPADGLGGAPIAAARTYNVDGDRTHGQAIPALDPAQGAALSGRLHRVLLTGLSSEDVARSNLGFVNLSDAPLAFEALFYDEGGNVLNPDGAPLPVTLGPGGWDQDRIENRFGRRGWVLPAGLRLISVEVRVTEGGPGLAYASVVDPVTGDPVFISGEPAP